MKILLTGAAGQLGRELKRSLACLGEVVACERSRLDLANIDALREIVRNIAPTAIVNAAAYTAVDKAETEPQLAMAINAVAPAILAEEAQRLGARLIHYSTDYVFDGAKSAPYSEDDSPAPLSAYGRSKLGGEAAIAASGARHLIFRTSWVYGLHGANFMKTMLRLGRRGCETGDELRVVGDQFGAPTWTRHLADATALILARGEIPEGMYHLAAAGETNWHEYAEAIFVEAQRAGLLEESPVVRRIASADYPLPAPRPANSRLDCAKFRRDFGLALPDWRIGLADCLADARF
ncbi:MAG: dTDP-4-dehydrorhamnose reductase [Sulfuritalea sp.]|jgi:dTDP-4-dehydrorhamnose reductase|nr:dTDP-4-dehydrorhamnose reductase [Sulfuritalea sp.]MDP1984806.1 dTDP-4-dehydrorhamnose reductase [Sulfuritalea sp.]